MFDVVVEDSHSLTISNGCPLPNVTFPALTGEIYECDLLLSDFSSSRREKVHPHVTYLCHSVIITSFIMCRHTNGRQVASETARVRVAFAAAFAFDAGFAFTIVRPMTVCSTALTSVAMRRLLRSSAIV
jgi:hypothetical protein